MLVGSGASSISQAFPSASVSGDLIVLTVKWGGQNLSVASITDNKGNLYQSAVGPTNWSGTVKCAQTYFSKNIAGGGSPLIITVRLTGASTSSLHLYQFEYSGADPNTPLDAVGAAIGTAASISVGALTTRYTNDLIHAAAFTDSGTTSPGTGFQVLTTYSANLVENETTAAAGTYNATATGSGGTNWFMHALAFKAAGGGTRGVTTPAKITPTAGTPQSATVNTAFATPLQATVLDAGNNPVSGVTVTFAAPASGASGTFAGGVNTATTNANGVATAATFTADGTAGGPYTVTASVAGVATPANFSLTNVAASTVAWPLKASANRRYLVDQNNVPFLLMGDAAHSLISAISPADMVMYMTTRASQGFNAIQVFTPCDTYETTCPASMASFSGVVPFTSGSSMTNYDLSTPNPAYWSIVDNILSTAAAHNLVVFLNPLETGGLLPLLEANGTTKVFNYGVFLGNRYKNTPNLVWDFGNDFQDWNSNPTDNNLIAQLMAGIASVDSNHLMDIELDYQRSYSNQDTTLAPTLSFDAAYTYFETYDCVLAAYNSSPTLPVFLIETNYEDENDTGYYSGTTGTFVLREQEYWTLTSGATGQNYGSHYTNHFISGWQSNLNTPGALEIVHLTQLFGSLPWWNLVPDQTHQIVTSGYGTYNGSNGNLPAANYSTTAWVTDGSLAVVYDPAGSALTVNLARFSGPVTARWYDPSNGKYTSITGSPFANTGSHVFSTPGNNNDGQSDWVLVLE